MIEEWEKRPKGQHKMWIDLQFNGIELSCRQIQKILNINKLKMNNRKRPSQIKFVKYERSNPNELWHVDWTTCPYTKKQLIAFIDDHSRFIVHAEFFENANAENTILAFINAIKKHSKPKETLTDNGTQFISDLFKEFCINNNIKHILGRIHHPQTNGKIERWFGTYKLELTDYFKSLDEFVNYYNNERLHQGIGYITPSQRFFHEKKDNVSLISV